MDKNALISERNFNTFEDVVNCIQLIVKDEEKLIFSLKEQLAKQCLIDSKMNSIGRLTVTLNAIGDDTDKLNEQVIHTAELAKSVSAKVRCLDVARTRASECQQRVHDLIDLQLCSHGVLTAIAEEEYEKGANHISRFLAMDQQLLHRTADDVQGSVTYVNDAVRTLEGATEDMRKFIARRFDEAVNKDDLTSVERFFKIFPLIGCHQEGIEKFSKYICSKLSTKAKKELRNSFEIAKAEKRQSLAYADTLTDLLENFARVIEVNQPIIEAYYGTGYILAMVTILQKECDLEVESLITEFRKNRHIARRIHEVNDNQRTLAANSSVGKQVLGHYRNSSEGFVDKLNPKDIDLIIAELTIMHSRAELYFRFMRRKVMSDIESISQEKEIQKCQLKALDTLLKSSHLSLQMQELLGTYLLFERYFMEESVLKAIALDTYEPGQQCSSMVDEVFFILRKSIRRSLATQSVNGICAVINNAASCLDGEFVNTLKATLKIGYSSGYIDLAQAYNAIQSSLQQGKLQSNDTEKAKNNFLVQLNNADLSTEYIETLWQAMEKEIKDTFPIMSKVECQILDSCIAELKAIRDSLKSCVDFGMQQLRSSAVKPRLNPWVDQFLNQNHYFTEEEYAAYEAGETFVQSLIVQIDGLLSSFKNSLSSRNYDALVSIIAAEVTLRLEHAIKKSSFNRLGGLALDQEVRALAAYLTGATSWSVRDKMSRLTQIATILNLEKVSEFTDYWSPESGSEMSSWRISPSEVRTILTLRSDFRMEDIKRIHL